jgi:hypothetical protein
MNTNHKGTPMNTQITLGLRGATLLAAAAAALLAACGSGSGSSVTVAGDVPIAYAMRSTTLSLNPTDGTNSAPGGDLMLREKSSPSAKEHNLTARFTRAADGTRNGDVSDPEVSYDGKKIVFSMRCPSSNPATLDGTPNTAAACTGRWNIWEYDMSTGGLTGGSFRRITASTADDDVDPAYLPAGRGFVFSSNRQTSSKSVVNGQSVYAIDEYERERVLNLHTMDPAGGAITQISVNQSHDRNPIVRPNGDIMFSRWEHVGPRNRFAIFTVKQDGTNMFVKYGAHSPGNSFLHPRDMDPAGRYKGMVTSDLMSLSGTQEGGALMMIDIGNYSEQNTPATTTVPTQGGQVQATARELSDGRGLSEFGRVTTPYPLWDGTDRVLTAYRPCEVTRNGSVVPCSTLTQTERTQMADRTLTRAQRAALPVQDNAPAAYAIYMVDLAKQTWLNVAAPPPGFMYVDPVAIEVRPEPNATQPTQVDAALASQGLGLIEVRSIYDTDGLDRMGESVIAASDLPNGCSQGIAKKAPTEVGDTRSMVADLMRMKDPADAAYRCSPARFVRAFRAVAPQSGMTGMREAIGETDFEPQQILGYAPVEPDGSFKLVVPADVPLGLAITDQYGRGLQTHLNWIQIRPGERRTCDGCHSPRRGASLNAGATVNTMPAALVPSLAGQHQSGETMAALRTRLNASLLNLQPDLFYRDVWADTTRTGVVANAPITIRYTGNTNPADDLATPAPVNGLINYPQHIQPLWARNRGASTCTNCHTDPTGLDLRATIAGTGRMVSYEELLLGDPVIDAATGQPQTRLVDGVPMVVRGEPLVETGAGGANGLARSSRLTEILFGQQLKASAASRTAFPDPPAGTPNHATMLNAAEKRLVSEWMDGGGQYYNDMGASGSVRRVAGLSQTTFQNSVAPILQANCASCHTPGGTSGAAQPAGAYLNNRFVLTGSAEGDFNASLSMVSDVCNAAANALVRKPSTAPHPSGAAGQTPLPAGSANYTTILNWIAAGC